MNLQEFCFPVVERPVAVFDDQHDFTDWQNRDTYLPSEYKSIVRQDTNEVISIVRRSYKIVPNQQLIDNLAA